MLTPSANVSRAMNSLCSRAASCSGFGPAIARSDPVGNFEAGVFAQTLDAIDELAGGALRAQCIVQLGIERDGERALSFHDQPSGRFLEDVEVALLEPVRVPVQLDLGVSAAPVPGERLLGKRPDRISGFVRLFPEPAPDRPEVRPRHERDDPVDGR